MITSSGDLDALATALASFQSTFKNPPKNKTNPFFNSTYVDLADALDVVRKGLSEQGLSFIQLTSAGEDRVILHTRLLHVTGQWIEGTYPVTKLAKAQEMGSALTYARRYALFALVGIAGEDDDDGNVATHGDAKPNNAQSVAQKAVAKATEKQMAKIGLTPEESKQLAGTLGHEINNLYDKKALEKWNAINTERKDSLLPTDREFVKKVFFDRLAEVK
jgi:hypothetical protein